MEAVRRSLAVLATGVAVVMLALGSVAAADDGGRPLSTALTGAEEAPNPGDPNATGQADLTLNQGQNEVCFEISWADVDGEVFAGHIHVGPAGVAGPVVVTLFTGSFAGTDSVSGCVQNVDPELIKAVRQNPTAYYVNVHSRPNFPGGAVRGQLGD
jgi:CHRD domain